MNKTKNAEPTKDEAETIMNQEDSNHVANEGSSKAPNDDGMAVSEASASEAAMINDCIDHARDVIATQLGLVKDQGYDFAPEFQDMTTQLYLFGVMWKYAEDLNGVEDAREMAFKALGTMLLQDGMKQTQVPKRVAFLRNMSKVEDGSNALAVAIGYDSQLDDHSLAEVFDHYIDDVQVSGAFWRLYDRCKKTMLYGGLSVAFIVIWFITLFMPGNSAISIFAAGLISAALFVIPVFLVGLLIYHKKIKKTEK